VATKIIITNYKNFKCGVKLNDGELVNVRFQTNEDVQIGDIYKVKITEILPNDSGAFVSYGVEEKKGFFKRIILPDGEKVHEGQSVLLQVRSIGAKDKVHLFTNNIILTGKFINVLPYGDEIILSRRTRKNLDSNEQDKIMDALSESEVGLIVRHNLNLETVETAKLELKTLHENWNEIELNAKEIETEGLVFQNSYFDQNFVCDYSDKNTDQIVFSDNKRFNDVKSWDESLDGSFASLCKELSSAQVDEEFNITEKIDYLIESKYSLPSGGNIMFGKTDALTAIDVNTGAAKRFDTNREAIKLIAKLIKLKNISGKIVIDPVSSDQNTLRKLVGMLKNEFRDDLNITNVYGFTRGGLLELSRSRNDRSIDELVFG
jgi:ribonuclease G|tara:strand:+ start:63 stop:1190 length:1128 start_codon:yes stop_codon:yes gene_type:complete